MKYRQATVDDIPELVDCRIRFRRNKTELLRRQKDRWKDRSLK